MSKRKVLIIDDDESLCSLLEDFLSEHDYKVELAFRGLTGIKKAKEDQPHLIVLDVDLPDLNGYEVCKKIRKISYLQNTPIIMLTARSGEQEEVRGFQSGVDDFISKPFKPKGLLARIETAIGRSTKQLDANALTHLPGNTSIFQEIDRQLQNQAPFAVIYGDLNNFKAFNDRYGFLRGDQAIKLAAQCLVICAERGAAFSSGEAGSWFVGHVGGDDFIFIVPADQAEEACKDIIERFDQAVPNLYDEEDRQRGYILGKTRQGQPMQYPFVGIALVIVSNADKRYTHPGEISSTASELKSIAKSFGRSAYISDRRRNAADVAETVDHPAPPPTTLGG
jgi:diguanylate cyclase (GGDEF)-like protein